MVVYAGDILLMYRGFIQLKGKTLWGIVNQRIVKQTAYKAHSSRGV